MVAKIYHASFRRGGENLKERKQGLLLNSEFVVHFVPILTLPDNVCML